MKNFLIALMLGCTVLFFMDYSFSDVVDYFKDNFNKKSYDIEISQDKTENGYYLDKIGNKLVKGKSMICTYHWEENSGIYYRTNIYLFDNDKYATKIFTKTYVIYDKEHKPTEEQLDNWNKNMKKGEASDETDGMILEDFEISESKSWMVLSGNLIEKNWFNQKEDFTKAQLFESAKEDTDNPVTCIDY